MIWRIDRDHPWSGGFLDRVLAHRWDGDTSHSQLGLVDPRRPGRGAHLAMDHWVLIIVRRTRQRRQNEIDQEVQKQLAQQQNKPPSS